jgi:hypothetical protein
MPLISKLDEWSIRNDHIHIRGWCFDTRLPIQKVELVFCDPLLVLPLLKYGQPSPDVAALVSPKAAHNRFDESVAVPTTAIGCPFRLQFTLSDGTIVLGEADPDQTYREHSEKRSTAGGPVGATGGEAQGNGLGSGQIQAEIDAVKKREAAFRGNMVQEFLDRGEGNTYLHTIRVERAALVKQGQEASAKLETLVRRLEAEEARVAALRSELEQIHNSPAWRFFAPFGGFSRRTSGTEEGNHGGL